MHCRIGGRWYENRGLIPCYGGVLALLVLIGVAGGNLPILLPCLSGVGATMMLAIPTVRPTRTLMGALSSARPAVPARYDGGTM